MKVTRTLAYVVMGLLFCVGTAITHDVVFSILALIVFIIAACRVSEDYP